MERTTGFSAAAVLALQATGEIGWAGAIPLERCLPVGEYLSEIRRRGFALREKTTRV